MPAHINRLVWVCVLSLSQRCAYHMSNTIILLQWHVDVVGNALTVGQGYRPFTIMCSLLFHVNSWVSFVHCSIECRFYCPCCWTGYAGFSVQACFLNSLSAVLSLNSLCQFIFCINNLLPREVISFGMFYHLFCCCNIFTLLSKFSLITIELEPDVLINGILYDSCDGLW